MKMGNQTFFPFYKDRISRVIGKLQSEYREKGLFSENIWSGIACDLYEVFHQAAVRCLITELHICRETGQLSGKTSEEEYECYCILLEDESYVNAVYQKYSGLLYYMEKLEEIQIRFWEEMLGCLVNDWEEIKDYFHLNEESYVLSVRRSGSDFHCKGKSVVIIETDQKRKMLYKPHSIENEIFLQNLLAVIYRALGLREFLYLELGKKGYGWVEEVTWEECGNNEEVARFYKRAGVMAATAYVLGIGDLHYENVVAHGEFPVIIDAETLFQHMDSIYQWTEKTTNFYSVLSSGLFPGGTADQNTAGLASGDGSSSSKKMPIIMHDKTSEICVEYQQIPMQRGKNRCRYMGKATCWEDFEQEIIMGFQLAYEWFRKNKKEVLRDIYARRDILRSRYVSGATQFFGLGVFASVHPKLMTNKYDRQHYLEKLCEGRKLGKQEAEAMLWGDIPCFHKSLTDQSVYDGQEIVVHQFFRFTVMEEMEMRMHKLSTEDCTLQEKVIAYSGKVFNRNCELEKKYREETIGDGTDIGFNGIKWAKDIADHILRNSIRQQDQIFWLGMEEENGTIKIRPVDIYFYNGIAGIAVFFRWMNQVCGLYEDVCEKLEGMLFSYTDRIYHKEMNPVTEYPGMYCGEGSVGYAYQLLYRITGDKKYWEYADKHSQIVINCSKPEASFDLLYGNAGAVLVLCQQYVDTGDITYLSEARKVLEYLDYTKIETEQGITWFEKAEGNPVCSIAHGNSGVMLAYARVQSLDPNANYWDGIKEMIKYEDQFYSHEYKNWADLRKKGEDRWKTYAWCNGGIGVIAARLQAVVWNFRNKELFGGMSGIGMINFLFGWDSVNCEKHGCHKVAEKAL